MGAFGRSLDECRGCSGGEQPRLPRGVRRHVRAPMFLVRNPVPPGWHFATTQDRSIAREALDLPQGAPIVTVLGASADKRVRDSLIDAWSVVSKA